MFPGCTRGHDLTTSPPLLGLSQASTPGNRISRSTLRFIAGTGDALVGPARQAQMPRAGRGAALPSAGGNSSPSGHLSSALRAFQVIATGPPRIARTVPRLWAAITWTRHLHSDAEVRVLWSTGTKASQADPDCHVSPPLSVVSRSFQLQRPLSARGLRWGWGEVGSSPLSCDEFSRRPSAGLGAPGLGSL